MNENLLEKKNVRTVIAYLQNFDPNLSLISLNTSARTAKDAADSLNVNVGAIVKSLLFKTHENKFYLCLVSGDKYVSEDKLATITQKTITKANANEVKKQTGFSIGGVAPVAHNSPPTCIFIDENLKRFKMIYAAAGHPYVVFGISFEQICQITNGKVINFVE